MRNDIQTLDRTMPSIEGIRTDTSAGFHKCPHCGTLVSDERSELLGIDECIPCTPQKRPPIGAWDYPEGFHERNEGVGGLVVID